MEKHTWRGRSSGIERWNPTSRQKRARYGAHPSSALGKGCQSFDGASPRLYQPTYAGANMGHPDRVGVSGRADDQAPFHPNLGSVKPVANFTESRTRGPCQHSRSGKSGYSPVLGTNPGGSTRESRFIPTHSCGWVGVLKAVHFTHPDRSEAQWRDLLFVRL